jgi:glutamate racemase
LADFIEQDHKSSLTYNQKKDIVWHCVGEVQEESIVLACTHYGVRYDIFERLYPNQTIIDPSQESAKMLVHYLLRHPEIEQSLTKWGNIEEYWTW